MVDNRNLSKGVLVPATTDADDLNDQIALLFTGLTSAGVSATGAPVTVTAGEGGHILDASGLPVKSRTYAITATGTAVINVMATGTGAVTFTGGASGYYVDASKLGYVTNSVMVAAVTFNNRSVAFTTSNTSIAGGPGAPQISAPSLDMSGTLSYAAGTNAMTGTATTTNGMSGNMNGKFYGPALNEVGGTYAVTGSGIGSMVGGFGGKR
jgi:hypothetical protein